MTFIITFNGQDRTYNEGIVAKDWQEAEQKAKLLTGGEFFTIRAIYA